MQARPSPSYNKSHSSTSKRTTSRIHSYSQHGAKSRSILLSLPPESLTHVTAYLDPSSLFKLSLCCRRLRDHVAQDAVWHRAYVWAYLGIGPEGEEETEGKGSLMLRRRENTWKKEYISRWMLIRRVQYSRNATVTHVPTHSAVSSHLFFPTSLSLLSASLAYGIVARSLPITGRVLKGYLDANGTFNGIGIGNPNAEFSVEVSAIELSREGDTKDSATGRILWGFRNGDVAVTRGVKPSEVGRAARLLRSSGVDSHSQRVTALIAGPLGSLISAGADGRVKIWDGTARDAHTLRLIWTSALAVPGTVIGTLCKLAYEGGFLATASTGGQVLLWTAIDIPTLLASRTIPSQETAPFLISPPSTPTPSVPTPSSGNTDSKLELTALLLNPVSASVVLLLTHHIEADHFWRLRVTVPQNSVHQPEVERTRFAGGSIGAITSVAASFTSPQSASVSSAPSPRIPSSPPEPFEEQTMFEMSDIPSRTQPTASIQLALDIYATVTVSKARSFIVTGDASGRVCIWDWEAAGLPTFKQGVLPKGPTVIDFHIVDAWKRWEAHDDGAVTALQLGGGLLATGSAQGSLKLWDPLPPVTSPHPLRALPSPSPRPQAGGSWEGVTQISFEGDVIVASVGSRVSAWRGGNLGRDRLGKGKGKGRASSKAGSGKYSQQIEMNREISDSRRAVQDEQTVVRINLHRDREQREKLDELGLDEIGALEYALMVSRDEEERRLAEAFESLGDTTSRGSESPPTGEELDEVSDLSARGSRSSSFSQAPSLPPSRHSSTSPSLLRSLSSSARSTSSYMSSPRLLPSLSNSKVQVSPMLRPEPMHAGASFAADLSISPPLFSLEGARWEDDHSRNSTQPATTPVYFPSLPPSARSSAQTSPQLWPADGPRSVSRSPHSGRPRLTGWNVVARSPPASSPAATDITPMAPARMTTFIPEPAAKPIGPIQSPGRTSLLSAQLASLSPKRQTITPPIEDEDELLRYVMALSLAEARSAGLDV